MTTKSVQKPAREGRGQVHGHGLPATAGGSHGQPPAEPTLFRMFSTVSPARDNQRAATGSQIGPPARATLPPLRGQVAGGTGQETETCPSCGSPTTTRKVDDWPVGPQRLDPTPLTPTLELEALERGSRTWTLERSGQVSHRDRWRITGRPANRYTVYATHTCPKEAT